MQVEIEAKMVFGREEEARVWRRGGGAHRLAAVGGRVLQWIHGRRVLQWRQDGEGWAGEQEAVAAARSHAVCLHG